MYSGGDVEARMDGWWEGVGLASLFVSLGRGECDGVFSAVSQCCFAGKCF